MIINEAEKGKILVNGKSIEISQYTRSLASLFELNQIKLKTVEGNIQTLWFNEKAMVVKELIPSEVIGAIRKEFMIN